VSGVARAVMPGEAKHPCRQRGFWDLFSTDRVPLAPRRQRRHFLWFAVPGTRAVAGRVPVGPTAVGRSAACERPRWLFDNRIVSHAVADFGEAGEQRRPPASATAWLRPLCFAVPRRDGGIPCPSRHGEHGGRGRFTTTTPLPRMGRAVSRAVAGSVGN